MWIFIILPLPRGRLNYEDTRIRCLTLRVYESSVDGEWNCCSVRVVYENFVVSCGTLFESGHTHTFAVRARTMKTLSLFSLCVICVETKLESEFVGESRTSVHISFFAADTRHERQIQDPRQGTCSEEEIFHRQSAILCDPSNDGNGQQLVHIYNEQCRYDATIAIASAARDLVQSCSRDDNGRFCYQLRQNASNHTYSVTTNCPRQGIILSISVHIHVEMHFKT